MLAKEMLKQMYKAFINNKKLIIKMKDYIVNLQGRQSQAFFFSCLNLEYFKPSLNKLR